jgi:hypothetical protein
MGEPVPDLEMTASVRARELRFRHVPQVRTERLEFPDGRGETRQVREGLPDRTLEGRRYRNVRVRAWLRTRLINRS